MSTGLESILTGTPETDRGLWRDVPMSDYHSLAGVSNSQLALVELSPLRYRLTMDGRLKSTDVAPTEQKMPAPCFTEPHGEPQKLWAISRSRYEL